MISDVEKRFRTRPKAELHVHLEGALPLEFLNLLAAAKGREPIMPDIFAFKGFEEFALCFFATTGLLEDEEDFYQAARAFMQMQAAENIVYTECSFMPAFHVKRGVAPEAMFRGLYAGLREGMWQHNVKVRLLFSMSRMFGAEAAEETFAYIRQFPDNLILGIDLAGMEVADSILPFAPYFEKARAMGLETVAHAGEFAGPDHVKQTIEILQPKRIGHGLGAALDDRVCRLLTEKDIALEISPSSNVLLGAAASYEDHPLAKLAEIGVPVTLNTDDPVFFSTSLSKEYSLAHQRMGIDMACLADILANGFRYSFLEPEEKTRWMVHEKKEPHHA
ncbi:MAG: adenosine deaminase [Desulfatibacillum sp.]|nr:adenosine deaminase [Desulfatibacillum sp.]